MSDLLRRIFTNSGGSAPVYIGLICLALVGAGLVGAVLSSGSAMITKGRAGPSAAAAVADQDRLEKERQERQRQSSWQEISPHHWRVVGWVLECTQIREVPKLPPYLRTFFDPLQPDLTPLKEPISPPARLPHHHEMALVQISHAIADHRQVLAAKVSSTYRAAQIALLGMVVLGFVTTLVVSFNSTAFGQGDGKLQQWTRFMAIVLTTLGTALSAVIAFYGPLDEWNDTKRTLAGLTSLHNVIGLETWKLDCLEFDGSQLKANSDANKLVMQRFEEWTKRYYELQTVAGSVQTEKPGGATIPQPAPPSSATPASSATIAAPKAPSN